MTITTITGPVIGAVIGYITNYIAVKMLFRPLRPIKIGKFTVPFTPGIIPKGKNRLGKAIGDAIGDKLLTEEDIAKTMLSEEMKNHIRLEVKQTLQNGETNGISLGDLIQGYTGEEVFEKKKTELCEAVTVKIVDKASEMSIGKMIADEVGNAIKEKVKGTFLAMMVNDELIKSFAPYIIKHVDAYIDENGVSVLEPYVSEEIDQLTQKTTGDFTRLAQKSEIDIPEIVIRIYEKFIHNKLNGILKQINFSKIVETKIIEMDVMDLEQLVLSVMKKELNAVVNLGALIGFILGLFNLIF
jgi:Uncharacterized protein conserved in bacteria